MLVKAFSSTVSYSSLLSAKRATRCIWDLNFNGDSIQTRTTPTGNEYLKSRLFATLAKDGITLLFRKEEGPFYRADRVLANRSGSSRKESFDLFQAKRVFLVLDDENESEDSKNTTPLPERRWAVVGGPSTHIPMNALLLIDRTHVVPQLPPLLMAYHKPKWVLSVRKDTKDRPHLSADLLPKLHPVGRLDYDSSGLLLFSSKGALTQILLHPKHLVTKEYEATVTGKVDKSKLQQQLADGVVTGEGTHTAELLSVKHMPDDQVQPYLQDILQNIPQPEYNLTDLDERGFLQDLLNKSQQLSVVRLQVHEGRYRMVRRMLHNCGHSVVTLVRQKFGAIGLGDDKDDDNYLKPGQYRELTAEELAWAESLLSATQKKQGAKYVCKKQRESIERRKMEQLKQRNLGDDYVPPLPKSSDKKKNKKKKLSPEELRQNLMVQNINDMLEKISERIEKGPQVVKGRKWYHDPKNPQPLSEKSKRRKRRQASRARAASRNKTSKRGGDGDGDNKDYFDFEAS